MYKRASFMVVYLSSFPIRSLLQLVYLRSDRDFTFAVSMHPQCAPFSWPFRSLNPQIRWLLQFVYLCNNTDIPFVVPTHPQCAPSHDRFLFELPNSLNFALRLPPK